MSQNTENTLLPEQEDIYRTVDTVNSQLETLNTYIARRFDELSMEINATAQQVDMAEDGITKRFSEVLEILGAINYSGAGDSAANSGVELEAVIEDTEKAANNILDAADRIVEYVSDDHDWTQEKVREDMRTRIRNDIQEILMACTFQDLTGQRIRNTLNNLHTIEARLSATFEKLGINVKPDNTVIEQQVKKAANQGEIDDIFQQKNEVEGASIKSQDDIDSLFD